MQGDVVSKTLNPVWGALPPAFNKAVPDAKTIKQPTILEFETFKDTIAQQTLEVVLWDKDRFSSVRDWPLALMGQHDPYLTVLLRMTTWAKWILVLSSMLPCFPSACL